MSLQKKNFLEIIDRELNKMEFYLKTRFEGIGFINKSNPKFDESGHLTVVPSLNQKLTSKLHISFTTVLRPIQHVGIDGEKITELALSLPRETEDYKKTWGKVDLILARHNNKFYYFDAKHLITFLDNCLSTCEYSFRRNDVIKYIQFDRRKLISFITLTDLDKLGILVMQDEVQTFKSGDEVVFVIKNDFGIELPKQFLKNGSCPFKRNWATASADDKRAWWKEFSLKAKYADRSKPIVVVVQNGKREIFPSTAIAAIEMEKLLGEKIDPMCITHCLKGRQKCVLTSRGKFTAFYESETPSEEDIEARFTRKPRSK